MLRIGQRIHHRHRCRSGHLGQGVVRERAQHDGVDQSRQVPRHVCGALSTAEADLVRAQRDGVASEAGDRHFEADPRAQARLLEQERDLAPLERAGRGDGVSRGAQQLGAVEQTDQAKGFEVLRAQQMPWRRR